MRINKSELSKKIGQLKGIVPSRTTIEALKGVLCSDGYLIASDTNLTVKAKLEGMTVTAAYGGIRGNDIAVACVAEAGTSTFAVRVYLGADKVEEYTGLTTIADLIAANSGKYVVFSATSTSANLTAFASTNLENGTDGSVTNTDITSFLDASEKIKWNTMAFPKDESSQKTAVITKIKYLREQCGKTVQAVLPDAESDYEGIINVTNSYAVDGQELTKAQACAWVAGATAGADKTTSNTNVAVEGATDVVGLKTNEEAIEAISNCKNQWHTVLCVETVTRYFIIICQLCDVMNQTVTTCFCNSFCCPRSCRSSREIIFVVVTSVEIPCKLRTL